MYWAVFLKMRRPGAGLAAEGCARVDLHSEGRLVLGVCFGYLKHEFEEFAIPQESKRERCDENLAVLREAWKNGSRKAGRAPVSRYGNRRV